MYNRVIMDNVLKINFVATEDTKDLLNALNDFAEQRFHDTPGSLGPGRYPFKSAILRKALEIAAPAIRQGLEVEGASFLYS